MRLAVALAFAGCGFDPQRTGATVDDASDLTDASHDGSELGCPSAPTGCAAFECAGSSSCYYLCAPLTWTGARDRCVANQVGCLATIDSASEDMCLSANTSPTFLDLVWFGYRQAANQASPDVGWSWECGASSYVAPFATDDRNNHENNSENCASIDAGGWIDSDCGIQRRYVCELPR